MMHRTGKQKDKHCAQPRGDILSDFLDVAATTDVTPSLHFVVLHFATWMDAHGGIDR
jgi:hypothetical protein